MTNEQPAGGPSAAAALGGLTQSSPIAASPEQSARPKKLSIVIPVYNEEAFIQTLVGLVVQAPLPEGVVREIICVNDCSKDGTAAKLDELAALYPGEDIRVFHKPVNEGKGA